MNTAHVQRLLIDLGFLFKKTDESETGRLPVWQCLDDDGVPLAQSKWLGELVRDVESSLGGI